MLTKEEIKKIISFCQQRTHVVAMYVFESMATSRERKKSDIDLAVMVRRSLNAMERVEMETALSNLLHRDVDLVVFHQGSPLLQHQILMYGRLIYEADRNERVRQEVYSRREYLDSAFLYRKLKMEKAHG